jgi:hypothetical protein
MSHRRQFEDIKFRATPASRAKNLICSGSHLIDVYEGRSHRVARHLQSSRPETSVFLI